VSKTNLSYMDMHYCYFCQVPVLILSFAFDLLVDFIDANFIAFNVYENGCRLSGVRYRLSIHLKIQE
jgi:hypothetical protein